MKTDCSFDSEAESFDSESETITTLEEKPKQHKLSLGYQIDKTLIDLY